MKKKTETSIFQLVLVVSLGVILFWFTQHAHGQSTFGLATTAGVPEPQATLFGLDSSEDGGLHQLGGVLFEQGIAPQSFQQKVESHQQVPVYTRTKFCANGRCWYENVRTGSKWSVVQKIVTVVPQTVIAVEASPTPMPVVRRILRALRPKRTEVIVDYGCGDARFLIEAVKTYGCRAVGVEIDIQRAAIAQHRVNQAGLGHRIRIVHGDATKLTVQADVGVAYLYSETLVKLRPRIRRLKRFASYMHSVDGLPMTQTDNYYIWKRKPVRPVTTRTVIQPQTATWNGDQYSGPVCNNRWCPMCNSIRRQLARN